MYYSKQIKDGKITSVEGKSTPALSPDFVKATEREYTGFIASLPLPLSLPSRDLMAEIDVLRARVKNLETLEMR